MSDEGNRSEQRSPIRILQDRVTQLESRVAASEAQILDLQAMVSALQAHQMKWAPPFQFPMPPLQVP